MNTCIRCDGEGWIMSEPWQNFWDWIEKEKEINGFPSIEKRTNWWKERGYPESMQRPDQDITCYVCGGVGEV